MYHDVVEIECGDVCVTKQGDDKKEIERKAMEKLKEDFPEVIKDKVWQLFNEFEGQETREAKFAKAIDALDAEIHFLDYKEYWKGWTPQKVRDIKPWPQIKEFPELEEAYEKVFEFAKNEGYFNQ
jgi:putative hydrolases of HD superfamily